MKTTSFSRRAKTFSTTIARIIQTAFQTLGHSIPIQPAYRPLKQGSCSGRRSLQKSVRRPVQIQAGLLRAPTAVRFECGDLDNTKPLFVAFYNETDPVSAVITDGSDQVVAMIQRSGSGARYAAPGVEF
jgi:membrane-bound inhibitor of C-type lysozyme